MAFVPFKKKTADESEPVDNAAEDKAETMTPMPKDMKDAAKAVKKMSQADKMAKIKQAQSLNK